MAHNQKIDAAPSLSPGCDYFTRSTRGPFIDTGVDIDQFTPMGDRIYVSEDTVGEWARMFGWISPDLADALRDEAEVARTERDFARAEVERLRVIEQALTAGGFRVPDPEQIPITEYPHNKGSGWWLLSNGERFRGSAEAAEAAEAALHAEAAA